MPLEKLPEIKVCKHPGHNPPSHMVIPSGHFYIHSCPSCGQKQTITRPTSTLSILEKEEK